NRLHPSDCKFRALLLGKGQRHITDTIGALLMQGNIANIAAAAAGNPHNASSNSGKGRARHSVRAGLGPGAYGGAHGVTRPTRWLKQTPQTPTPHNPPLPTAGWRYHPSCANQPLAHAGDVSLQPAASRESARARRLAPRQRPEAGVPRW